MQTIRNVAIKVHLESGTQELRVPNIAPFLLQMEKQLELARQIEEQTRRVNEANAAWGAATGPGGGMAPGPMGPAMPAAPGQPGGGLNVQPAVIDETTTAIREAREELDSFQAGLEKLKWESWERGVRVIEATAQAQRDAAQTAEQGAAAQEAANQRVAAASRQAQQGIMQAGEGFFRLSRAAVLLGASSDESFGKMIQGLARMQAYWDLFKGTAQIIGGLNKALVALQMAQAAAATTSTAAAGGMTLYARAAAVATAANTALVATFGVLLAPLVALAVVVTALAAAYDALTTSEAEAAEAARKHSQEEASRIDLHQRHADQLREIEQMRREQMDPAQRRDAAMGAADNDLRSAQYRSQRPDGGPDNRERALANLRGAMTDAQAALAGYKEVLEAERTRVALAREIAQAKIEEIEAQEKIIANAERALAIEEQKRDAFNAQFGAMNQFEQAETKRIADKIRAKQQLEAWEEEFAATHGGANSIAEIRAARGAAAGGGDVWAGTADAHKVTESQDALKSEMAKLTEAIKDLTKKQGAEGAAEAKNKYRAEIKALEEDFEKFTKMIGDKISATLDTMELIAARIRLIETNIQNGI